MHSKFKVLKAVMSTVHAVTANQSVVDGPPSGTKPDMRRSRAAGFNISPTSTGAAKATTQVIPELAGKFDGISLRVPIITGSVSDITMVVEKKTTKEEVNQAFLDAKNNPFYKGVLDATYTPLVSSDIIKSNYSAVVDLEMTRVVDGDLVKILAWYDNEWGYSNRLVEMALLMTS
jgi:glyceraldehyde 3-phosphate dehydrogenase